MKDMYIPILGLNLGFLCCVMISVAS